MSSPLGQTRTSNVVFSAHKCTAPAFIYWMNYIIKHLEKINYGSYQLLKKDAATKIKTKFPNQVKSLKGMGNINKKIYHFLKLGNAIDLRFSGEQIYKLCVTK